MFSTASFRVGGKYIASVFNVFMLEPMCICNPNFAKWSWMVWAASSISFLLWKMKALSSMMRRLKRSKGVPADYVLCPRRCPLSFGKNLIQV